MERWGSRSPPLAYPTARTIALMGGGRRTSFIGQLPESPRRPGRLSLRSNLLSGPVGATDKAAARTNGTGGTLLQGSALLIADTTGALTRSGGGGIPLQGTN